MSNFKTGETFSSPHLFLLFIMLIYIQTPPINNSNKIPHLIEHCVHNKDNLLFNEYFSRCSIKSQTFYWYTKFDILNYDVNDFIMSIESPFTLDIVKKELRALNTELEENLFTMKLRKIVERELNLDVSNRIFFNDLVKYHKQYYNNSHYVVTDDKYNIVKCWIKIIRPSERKFNLLKKIRKKISNEMNNVIIINYNNWKDQVLMHFVEVLVDSWIEYNDRYINWKYYYPCSCMIEWNSYIAISIPHYDLDISKAFFEETKKYYAKQFINWDTWENKIINLLYINQLPTDDEVVDFITNLKYTMVFALIRYVW